MIEYTAPRITDKLPAIFVDAPVVTLLAPVDFMNVPYTPALLLPVNFGVSIMSDNEYTDGCSSGFDSYFEMIEDEEETSSIFSRAKVCAFVGENVCDDKSYGLLGVTSLAFRVGFCLGWLSALAFTDRSLASVGLDLLLVLLHRLQSVA